jgi:hypothetical protein
MGIVAINLIIHFSEFKAYIPKSLPVEGELITSLVTEPETSLISKPTTGPDNNPVSLTT